MKREAAIFLLMILAILFGDRAYALTSERDSIVVSLITCAPGKEVYELCGHSAIRVRSVEPAGMDSVWNYGTFDFNTPNFVYRFVKGETDYKLSGYPFFWFMPEYVENGREVTEQELNLTQEEAHRLLAMLREESKAENCRYRYNYVKDNCATRIIMRLDSSANSRVIYPDTVKYGTFRDEMRHFHRNYPWYQFGIDLALGSGLDYPLRGRDEMFSPVDMQERFAKAKFSDGRELVRSTRILNQGEEGATFGPTVWYLTPLFCCSMAFLLSLILCFYETRRKRIVRWLNSLWFGICGIAGCVVCFLVFVSEHEATSPNILLIWLNPLQLLMAIGVWGGRVRFLGKFMAWYNIVAVGCLLIGWPIQAQSANPAFFPLMGLTVALAIAYAIIPAGNSYIVNAGNRHLSNKDEKNSILGAVRPGFNKRGRSGGSR